MKFRISVWLGVGSLLGWCWASDAVQAEENPSPTFNRDVRPILSDNCFACHGPDAAARKADLRLDVREAALGAEAFVPGDAGASELVSRISAEGGDDLMPPPDSGHSLSEAEVATLTRWIGEGAKNERHWAFLPPRLPLIRGDEHAIDQLVRRRLEKEGVEPSPPADKATLIRRVTLDLAGLPPTLGEIDAFLGDDSPDAYERVVERLLKSPRYGEHMALYWLDAARYADTHGYFGDRARTMWPWRDWVIDAYNRNLPFDRFTIEQLAGDLLPEAGEAQITATGFNRNHMINNESGIIEEEFRIEYVADRVKTTTVLWLGLTMECARCHDHKFDPLTQREYYEMFAYFNQVPERGLDGSRAGGGAAPFVKMATAQQREKLDAMKAELARAEVAFDSVAGKITAAQTQWQKASLQEAVFELDPKQRVVWLDFDGERSPGSAVGETGSADGLSGKALNLRDSAHWIVPLPRHDDDFERDRAFSFGAWVYPTSGSQAAVISKIDDANSLRGFDLQLRKGKAVVQLAHRWNSDAIQVATRSGVSTGRWQHFAVTYDGSGKADGVAVYVDGIRQPVDIRVDSLQGSIVTAEPLRVGRRQASASFQGRVDEVFLYARELRAEDIRHLVGDRLLRAVAGSGKEDKTLRAKLRAHFLAHHADRKLREADEKIAAQRSRVAALEAAIPELMVMQEMVGEKARTTHVLERGEYNKPGDQVRPAVPAVFSSEALSPPRRADRLGLAQWLVDPAHPLTARVTVNRLWQQVFGRGLVATPDDFGLQGEWPTHPELLDWLAIELTESGWDIQHVLRLMVTSRTYRQSSDATASRIARDPDNRLLGRGPRFRLYAEQIRDQALAASGLLVERVGGPSVKPYQPPGLWKAVTYDGELTYQPDEGEGRHRRSLYSYWKRQAPPPALTAFDAPTRETCIVERSRTNTPLQALVLMNDPNFIEAARHLAARDVSDDRRPGLVTMFRRVLAREPDEGEVAELLALLEEQLAHFDSHRVEAMALAAENDSDSAVELAAWITVANVVLSLDETLTKR